MRKRHENTLISIAKTLVGKKKTPLKGKIMVRIGVLYGATYFTFSVQAMFCNNLNDGVYLVCPVEVFVHFRTK